ncbi:hypothetical protein Gogos_014971 [Gossypium gossypioides]|uniref:Uncharacterized protein n=1 Tax=Gossypium gossypioides TaxID=34282 RepID=A0A7J9C046_GOSGO|nr:hypothetical protein [Gossypium gossypioides]
MYGKSVIKIIGEKVGRVIKLDDYIGSEQRVDRRLRRADRIKGSGKDVKESANLKGSHFNVLLNLRNNGIDAVQNIMSGTGKDAGPHGIVKGSGSVNLGGSVMGISSTNSGGPIRDWEKSTDQRNPSTVRRNNNKLEVVSGSVSGITLNTEGMPKRDKKFPISLRGKSNKFKSRGSGRLLISEAMTRIVDDIERVATNSISEAKGVASW